MDRFGLRRTGRIVGSGIRNVFTPYKPIHEVDLLFDRSEEVARLVDVITTPGHHALVFGERGVGKSSLVNVATSVILSSLVGEENCYKIACTSSTRYEDIFERPLSDLGVDLNLHEQTKQATQGTKLAGGMPVLSAEATGEVSESKVYRRNRPISPEEVVAHLGPLTGLMVVDEADALVDAQAKAQLAETIKLLSDADSNFRVLVVGIGATATDLTGGHPSVQRCLAEIRLRRITPEGLRQIIESGASRLGLGYKSDVIDYIVRCSDGYPFFTHLLALKSGEIAIGDERTTITILDLRESVEDAVDGLEGSLRTAYDDATRSHGTDMYHVVLHAAALLQGPEFTSFEWRESIASITGVPIAQNGLNNYLAQLVSNDGTRLVTRIQRGVYRFSDPRMAAHIRIVNGHYALSL